MIFISKTIPYIYALLYLNREGNPFHSTLRDRFWNQSQEASALEVNDFAVTYSLIPFRASTGFVVKINVPVDAKLDFKGLAAKYGHPCEEHYVESEDGYVTKLFHLPGDRKRPVLMMHGIFDSADTFIIRGKRSMAISLANAGYDVWLANMRGNKHSRRHVTLNPDKDPEFWNFSYHEMALYDLPATIDYILGHTGQTRIYGIGHSQGNNIFFAMTAMLPQYNKKIKVFISLAPAVYIGNIEMPTKILVLLSPLVNYLFEGVGNEEILPDGTILQRLLQKVCPLGLPGYVLCVELILFQLAGYNTAELEREFLPIALGHTPSGSSRKNLNHLAQSGKYKRFAYYDAGAEENIRLYGRKEPPLYDLSAVTMKVAIFTGNNDKLVVMKDTARLRDQLTNVVEYRVLKPRKWNHVDFVWGRNADIYLFPYIHQLLRKY
ncbi:lysosomal acid lipase/cholesteryl ester hydrolase-like [Bombyx mandarina]|uniref:Lipase n=1 Tax=Bombyx mandarina TaxID=7092 RepID=A0A6J2JUY7_BOMMA|nr:lysosomal acid lipase/cholesteryl ester hydrolase-like [Bombyx mandarina]